MKERLDFRDVRALAGGIRAWIAAGYPIERDEPPFVPPDELPLTTK